jgi:hypothetical protein
LGSIEVDCESYRSFVLSNTNSSRLLGRSKGAGSMGKLGCAVLAPCGRCREFIIQLHAANGDTLVVVDSDNTIALQKLLPFR